MNISNNYYQVVFSIFKMSIKKVSSTTPAFIVVFLWFGSSCHLPLFACWSTHSCHIRHLWLEVVLIIFVAKALSRLLLLLLIATSIVLLLILLSISSTIHHPFSFFFSIKNHQFLTELLIWHT